MYEPRLRSTSVLSPLSRRRDGHAVARERRSGEDLVAGVEQREQPPALAAAVAALTAAVDALAAVDLDAETGRSLMAAAELVDRQVTRLQAQVGSCLVAIDERGTFAESGAATVSAWWRGVTGRDAGEASRQVSTARRLRQLPRLHGAVREGRASWAHATVVCRAAIGSRLAVFAEHDQTLTGLATVGTPAQLRVACQRIVDAVEARRDPPGGPDSRRELFLAGYGSEGLGDLRATLDPLTRERLANLLQRFDRPDAPDTPAEQRRTAAQRRHDAFDAVLRAAQAHHDAPAVQGVPADVLLLLDVRWLLAGQGRHELGSGTPLELPRLLELLEGDVRVTPVLMDGPWRPLAFGRTRRVLPDWLRPILSAIHGGCRGPHCDRPAAWTQAAHAAGDWHAGAETALDATLPLCGYHHRLLDHHGWRVDHDPVTGRVTWHSPHRGPPITTWPRGHPNRDPPSRPP